jgi:hypothetical protein
VGGALWEQQQRAVDLASEKTARLALPPLSAKSFERLAEIENQFRTAIGDHALGRASAVVAIFENPKPIDDRSEVDGRQKFPIPQQLRRISQPAVKSASVKVVL